MCTTIGFWRLCTAELWPVKVRNCLWTTLFPYCFWGRGRSLAFPFAFTAWQDTALGCSLLSLAISSNCRLCEQQLQWWGGKSSWNCAVNRCRLDYSLKKLHLSFVKYFIYWVQVLKTVPQWSYTHVWKNNWWCSLGIAIKKYSMTHFKEEEKNNNNNPLPCFACLNFKTLKKFTQK